MEKTEGGKPAVLLLEDGSLFPGKGFGAETTSVAEVVFTTGMVGYPESMTDPSFAGQLLCFTYPLIGNYGVPSMKDLDSMGLPRQFESESIKVERDNRAGVVRAAQPLGLEADPLRVDEQRGHPGDKRHRHEGAGLQDQGERRDDGGAGQRGRLSTNRRGLMKMLKDSTQIRLDRLCEARLAEEGAGLRDLGEEGGADGLRGQVQHHAEPAEAGLQRGQGAVRLQLRRHHEARPRRRGHEQRAGGPAALRRDTIKTTARLIDSEMPMLGICLGNQLVGLAQGAETYKLKYGHRGQNKPVVDVITGRGYVTSQNHGYSVTTRDAARTELRPWFMNADDGSMEGVVHQTKPCIAVQFHPEASPGPYDTEFVFDRFVSLMETAEEMVGEKVRSMKA